VGTILDPKPISILIGVFKQGLLGDGKMIAVKKLVQSISGSQKPFENEINLLMKLKHPNIVQLVSYCYETQHLHNNFEGKLIFAENTQCLLCLEYLPNGSLEKYITGMPLKYGITLISLRGCLIVA
jgi:serine/threonine protein kinase